MEDKEKRIVVRVDKERWRQFDDQRHAERTSFQDLGLRLFDEWLNKSSLTKSPSTEGNGEKSDLRANIHGFGADNRSASGSEAAWVESLLTILRSGNEVAARAIMSNLLAFSDYVRAVPEVPNGIASLAARAARLAALDQQILDEIKATRMGSGEGEPEPGQGVASPPRRGGVQPSNAGKKVG